MIKFSTLSTTKRVAIIFGVMLSAFLFGALIGYVRGALGDNGSTEQAIDWAIKTGLLGNLFIVVVGIITKIEIFVESNLKLPSLAIFPIGMGCISAIMDGSSVLLKIESGEFWSTLFSSFTMGFISGFLGVVLIKKF